MGNQAFRMGNRAFGLRIRVFRTENPVSDTENLSDEFAGQRMNGFVDWGRILDCKRIGWVPCIVRSLDNLLDNLVRSCEFHSLEHTQVHKCRLLVKCIRRCDNHWVRNPAGRPQFHRVDLRIWEYYDVNVASGRDWVWCKNYDIITAHSSYQLQCNTLGIEGLKLSFKWVSQLRILVR